MIKVLNLTPEFIISENTTNNYLTKLLKFHPTTAKQLVVYENIFYFHLKDGKVLCPHNSNLYNEDYFEPFDMATVKKFLRNRLPRNYKG